MSDISTISGTSSAYQYHDVVFSDGTDASILDPSSFLSLMLAQLQNQDFTNPVDDTEMITVMANYTNMQLMQEMKESSMMGYATSLVGKTATASRFTVDGDLDTTTGVIDKVSFVDNNYVVYIGGKTYELSQIMDVSQTLSGAVNTDSQDLEVSNIQENSVEITWPNATEDTGTLENLEYTIYYSIESDMTTVEDIEANGTMYGLENQSDLSTVQIVGLESATTYYVNVVVKQPDGTKTAYKQAEFETL